MIINTVIVFLRDLLPIFIMVSYLSVLFSSNDRYALTPWRTLDWVQSLLLGAASTLLLFFTVEHISDWFEGSGVEVTHVLLLCCAYICLLAATFCPNTNSKPSRLPHALTRLGIAAFMSVKGTELLFYFWVHGKQGDQIANMLIGCILGLGICVSFSLLFKFFLKELVTSRFAWVFWAGWYCFLAGQISQSTSLLSQVDLLSVGTPMFDLSTVVQDSSEYGYILNALLGYESSPSKELLLFYGVALFVPIGLHLILKRFTAFGYSKAAHYV